MSGFSWIDLIARITFSVESFRSLKKSDRWGRKTLISNVIISAGNTRIPPWPIIRCRCVSPESSFRKSGILCFLWSIQFVVRWQNRLRAHIPRWLWSWFTATCEESKHHRVKAVPLFFGTRYDDEESWSRKGWGAFWERVLMEETQWIFERSSISAGKASFVKASRDKRNWRDIIRTNMVFRGTNPGPMGRWQDFRGWLFGSSPAEDRIAMPLNSG